MALYVYPPRIINGTLYSSDNIVEYVRGKILQCLSIVRGELVADPFFGVPLRLFSSITDTQADATRIESVLQQEIPEATFRVTSSLPVNGQINLNVYWAYNGVQSTDIFEVALQ